MKTDLNTTISASETLADALKEAAYDIENFREQADVLEDIKTALIIWNLWKENKERGNLLITE